MSLERWYAVQEFLTEEARLLDERRFEEWLDLFTDDAVYWMPGRTNPWRSGRVEDSIYGERDLAVFEETKVTLVKRVARLRTGLAWAEEPPSRTRHVVANVAVEPGADSAHWRVRSNFLVYRAQLERDKDIFVGSRDDILRQVGDRLKIARRTIVMEDVVHDTKALSIFF